MDDAIAELVQRDGWHAEGDAARVHYGGDGKQFAVEYYAASERILYWRVPEDGTQATPVARDDVPEPLRTRIRRDLDAAGVDPEIEARAV